MMSLLRQLAPISVAIGVTIVCLVVKENFPFSHYPMYSNFEDQTYYVWLADREGEPIPAQTLTYHRLGKIKKIYNDGLLDVREKVGREAGKKPRKRDLTLEQRRAPGDETLRWIYDNSRPAAQEILLGSAPLRLYQVDVRIEDNQVVEDNAELVGQLSREQLISDR
ncbi:MAG: hypothetical protein ACI8XO_000037 [Verrucomicrobiales bacterium]|jgi:hypothetical protein